MRRTMNYNQRQKLNRKRQDHHEIKEASNSGEALPECQICFGPLTTNTKVKLQCKHDYYCNECMRDWYCKSQVDNRIYVLPIKHSPEYLNFPVYFNDSGVFKCPTCRCEYVVFHSDAKAGLFQPKKVIARYISVMILIETLFILSQMLANSGVLFQKRIKIMSHVQC